MAVDAGPAGEDAHGLPKLIAERRAKAARLTAAGDGPFPPYSYPGVRASATLQAAYAHLAPGEETEERRRWPGASRPAVAPVRRPSST